MLEESRSSGINMHEYGMQQGGRRACEEDDVKREEVVSAPQYQA